MKLERLFKVLVVRGAVLTAGLVGCEPSDAPVEGKNAEDATSDHAPGSVVANENDGATPHSMLDSADVVAAADATRLPDSMFGADDVATADAADASNDAAADGVGAWLSWG